MATDGPVNHDARRMRNAVVEVTAESLLDDSDADTSTFADESTDGTTPWTSMADEDESAAEIEPPSELAKPIIATPQGVLQPAITAVEAAHVELAAQSPPIAPVMAVSSASVTPTEDDLQVVSDLAEDAGVLSIGKAKAIDITSTLPTTSRGGWWTIPTLCAGLAIVACSLIIPQTDANRRLAWEREGLERDLKSIQKQVDVNGQFLERVADDANLAERLAQRQMKVYRAGTAVLELKRQGNDEMSPFLLTAVVPPDPLPAYAPKSGMLAELFLHPKHTLYLSGLGLLLIAVGLVMGGEKIEPKTQD